MEERIYFISQYDNQLHNVNDYEHRIEEGTEAYIGEETGLDEFRVDEEVILYTLREAMNFFDLRLDQ